MRLYFAATPNLNLTRAMLSTGEHYVLASYHYFKKGASIKFLKTLKKELLFIDSGAFSANTLGEAIALMEYAWFVKSIKPEFYAGLDVIGDAEATGKNNKRMESEFGCAPLPTFHMNEPVEYLHKMLREYDHLCLGGMVMSSNIEKWLDEVWNIIEKKAKRPKIHGFGMTAPLLVRKYPWFSVDSSSWHGGILYGRVPYYNNNFRFENIPLEEFFLDKGIKYKKKDKITREMEELVIKESCQQFINMTNHINKVIKNDTFSYITQQGKLF